MEIVAAVTLPHVVQLILDGLAFDLIKLGTEKLILRPLLSAQRKLKERNRSDQDAGDFAYLRIRFSDSNVVVDVNAVAGMHDTFQVAVDKFFKAVGGPGLGTAMRDVLNVPLMPPAAVLSYGALAASPTGMSILMDGNR